MMAEEKTIKDLRNYLSESKLKNCKVEVIEEIPGPYYRVTVLNDHDILASHEDWNECLCVEHVIKELEEKLNDGKEEAKFFIVKGGLQEKEVCLHYEGDKLARNEWIHWGNAFSAGLKAPKKGFWVWEGTLEVNSVNRDIVIAKGDWRRAARHEVMICRDKFLEEDFNP